MFDVKEFDSGVACIASYRETRARLRSLKSPGPKTVPMVEVKPAPALVAAQALPAAVEPASEGNVIPADIPPSNIQRIFNRPLPNKTAIKIVADFYRMPVARVVSAVRTADVVKVRHVAMYVLRKIRHLSLNVTGSYFNRDHTTVLHGVNKVKARLEADERFRDELDIIRLKISDALAEMGEG